MENGKWKMKLPLQREGSEGWYDFKIKSGKWKMENGKWKIVKFATLTDKFPEVSTF